MIPQINLSFVFDQNFITFLAGFFLLGGAEEEEDENFILEEEESDFVEDIVAPLYLSNLGKDVDDNAALYLKLNTVFAFVLFNNLIGMVPYSDTATSSLLLTF
jgi:F0F1-type ATP synthase membrane subunit a